MRLKAESVSLTTITASTPAARKLWKKTEHELRITVATHWICYVFLVLHSQVLGRSGRGKELLLPIIIALEMEKCWESPQWFHLQSTYSQTLLTVYYLEFKKIAKNPKFSNEVGFSFSRYGTKCALRGQLAASVKKAVYVT
jgi:hypothetical protein